MKELDDQEKKDLLFQINRTFNTFSKYERQPKVSRFYPSMEKPQTELYYEKVEEMIEYFNDGLSKEEMIEKLDLNS